MLMIVSSIQNHCQNILARHMVQVEDKDSKEAARDRDVARNSVVWEDMGYNMGNRTLDRSSSWLETTRLRP